MQMSYISMVNQHTLGHVKPFGVISELKTTQNHPKPTHNHLNHRILGTLEKRLETWYTSKLGHAEPYEIEPLQDFGRGPSKTTQKTTHQPPKNHLKHRN